MDGDRESLKGFQRDEVNAMQPWSDAHSNPVPQRRGKTTPKHFYALTTADVVRDVKLP